MAAFKELRILHLSDIHFGETETKKFRPEKAFNTLIKELNKREQFPDLVAITGDISYMGCKEGFDIALECLNSLKSKLSELSPFDSDRFFFVPGNHDVNCTMGNRGKTFGRFENYISFVNKFLENSGSNLKKIHWPSSVRGADDLNTAVALRSNDFPLDVLLLNSVGNYNPKSKSILIFKKEIEYFINKAKDLRNNNNLKIVLIHNPPIGFIAGEKKVVRNADELLGMLDECGVSLLLHGDFHESQHLSAARRLGSGPLYTVGAGRATPGQWEPQFHIINITFWDEAKYGEIEIISYLLKTNEIVSLDQERYTLRVPLAYESWEKVRERDEPKASIHIFELPESERKECENRAVKNILFAFYLNTLGFLKKSSYMLLKGEDVTFYPDQMYSFFYDSIFNLGEQGDFFRAVHRHDWTVWLSDASSFNVLGKHQIAANNGLNIERIIILPAADVRKLKKERKRRELLLELCKFIGTFTVDEDDKHFVTFLAREQDLKHFKRLQASAKPAHLRNILIGDISLFVKGDSFKNTGHKNAIAFFFNKPQGLGNILIANLSRKELTINFAKKCITSFWENGSNRVDCRMLRGEKTLMNFLNKGPKAFDV